MDSRSEPKNQKTLNQFIRSKFLSKLPQLLLSVSVFSFILSNSSSFSFLCSFNFYLTRVPLRLFSHTIDKNCIFLLCNGLLVFVAKFSGLLCSSSSKSDQHPSTGSFRSYGDDIQTLEMISKESFLENVRSQEIEDCHPVQGRESECIIGPRMDDKEKKEFTVEVVVQEEVPVTEDRDGQGEINDDQLHNEQEEEEDQYYDDDDDEEEEEEEEEENGVLSTEELNKKFEEFIRKMKEEIRIEAQQQLVMVS
ncbi:hypothetical protein K2173_015343 [Erythroxylum novogranatense]|uniref:Uncharacterized protein n=1 Tax=Erythroxylum novogranatense TaxID=1862640 RepID=A0AAV8SS56_9ROSI|nr:hypothetical protein K2173_015343 [Erythroxylum novogranatense]